MRNLFLLLVRFNSFFVFIFLEVFCFYLIIQNNHVQRSFLINSANAISGNFYRNVDATKTYFHLSVLNDSLMVENQRLYTKSQNLLIKRQYIAKNGEPISFLISDTSEIESYKVIAAKVINNSTNKRNNYLTLNKGKSNGVVTKLGVFSSNGIVGIVKDVSDNFATVISLLHTDIKISAKIATNNYFGSVIWDGKSFDHVILKDIPIHVKIHIGDKVVTTGYSTFFPENIIIGTIDNYEIEEESGFYSIDVKLSTNLKNIEYVYIIDYLFRDEKLQLEENTYEN